MLQIIAFIIMIDALVLLGEPLHFEGLSIKVPKVKEVVNGEHFHQYMSIFCLSQENIEDELTDFGKKKIDKIPTPFEFLLINCYQSKEYEALTHQAFKYFLDKDITIVYQNKEIVLGDLEEELLKVKDFNDLQKVTEENFFNLQNQIRMACGIKPAEPYQKDLIPKIHDMKQKARYRDKIKSKELQKKGGTSLSTTLLAICQMNVGLNLLNIGEISYAAIPYIMRMAQAKEKYDLDIKSLLAGADSKKVKPVYWIKDIELD